MREYELEVLEQYDIEVISTRKTRGAYFCNTKEGLMLLGPAGISVGRAPLMYVLLCYLESRHGMRWTHPSLRRRENSLAYPRMEQSTC